MRILLVLAIAVALTGCATGESPPVQYPPGQRPCTRALAATDAVTSAQLTSPDYGRHDPSGRVRAALTAARTPLRDRAGESAYYSASRYNAAADRVLATIGPLVAALDGQEDVPYELPAYTSAYAAYAAAEQGLTTECSS